MYEKWKITLSEKCERNHTNTGIPLQNPDGKIKIKNMMGKLEQ